MSVGLDPPVPFSYFMVPFSDTVPTESQLATAQKYTMIHEHYTQFKYIQTRFMNMLYRSAYMISILILNYIIIRFEYILLFIVNQK